MKPLMERLWAKIDVRGPDECWPFTGWIDHDGYGRIGRGGAGAGLIRTHRAVAEATHGPAPEGHEARHLCGSRNCCNPRHLAWGTREQNQADRIMHGTAPRGSANHFAKLNEADVIEIRQRAQGEPSRALAAEFGVSESAVDSAITRRSWAWLA